MSRSDDGLCTCHEHIGMQVDTLLAVELAAYTQVLSVAPQTVWRLTNDKIEHITITGDCVSINLSTIGCYL